jgi:CMP-N,N'-diacetyllegionaminic acid synthase
MYKDKKILAVVPARGGSKGLPKKNIRPLLGKPLIAWSIEQAQASKYIDKVVVSTDDKEISEVAVTYGADVPFMRPDELAQDGTLSIDVILHCINYFESVKDKYDIIVMVEPTSPLRETEDLDKAIEMLVDDKKAESIVGLCKVEAVHPAFLVKLEDNLLRPYINKDFKVLRRQEIDDLYFFEGSLYISYSESLKKRKSFYHDNCLAYVVPRWKSYELDDISDLVIMEAIIKARIDNIII